MGYINTYREFINESDKWIETEYKQSSKDNTDRLSNRNTSVLKILEFIYKSGNDGVKYTDIIKFIMEEIKGETYNPVEHRGYFSGMLTGRPGSWRGGGGQTYGILYRFCEKKENGRWILKDNKLQSYFMKSDMGDMLTDDELDALAEII